MVKPHPWQKSWTVLIADKHPLFIEGLRRMLPDPEFAIVGTVTDGHELVKAALELCPDLIVACITLRLLNGVEAARQIHRAGLHSKIILLSEDRDPAFAVKALQAGANGFLLKTSPISDVLAAAHTVLQQKLYLPASMEQEIAENLKSARVHRHELTPRQREVLQLLTEGKPPKEIAAILHISPRTVEFHKYTMLEKLGLETSATLIAWAAKQGVL